MPMISMKKIKLPCESRLFFRLQMALHKNKFCTVEVTLDSDLSTL